MATLLMLVIFCGFVGLGIPDSMFGASWPAIYSDFQIPISYANFVTIILSIGTIVSSFLSGQINSRFSAVSVSVVTFTTVRWSAPCSPQSGFLVFRFPTTFGFCVCALSRLGWAQAQSTRHSITLSPSITAHPP